MADSIPFDALPAPEPLQKLVIKPQSGWPSLQLRELWSYRELLYFLVWRDIKVRYKQTALGVTWAIIQPLLAMIVFTIFFGRLAKLPSDGIPYPVFAYAGLLPWNLFAQALGNSSQSVVLNQNLITKVYFPRLIVPLSTIVAGMVDFVIGLVVLFLLMFHYGILPPLAIITLPLFMIFSAVAALAVGLWLSALNVQYRDVRYVVPFLIQIWMFATPIAYGSSLVPAKWRVVFGLNPMSGVVEGFRWAVVGSNTPPGAMFAVSMAVVVVLLVGGLYYFRSMERTFADVV